MRESNEQQGRASPALLLRCGSTKKRFLPEHMLDPDLDGCRQVRFCVW
jgi:hypothetical protein